MFVPINLKNLKIGELESKTEATQVGFDEVILTVLRDLESFDKHTFNLTKLIKLLLFSSQYRVFEELSHYIKYIINKHIQEYKASQ